MQRLRELPRLLTILDLRIVLFVEDADRAAGAGFDPTQLERLLWILKELAGVTFVLALSKESAFDVSKLCDHVEVLPLLNQDRVAGAMNELRTHWQREYTYVIPGRRRKETDPLQFEADSGLSAYLRAASGRRTPTDVISQVLRTPRRLKHVVRRVGRTWATLHGEVDLNDLIVISVLREGAPDVLDFLIWNIDAARQEASDFAKAPKEGHDAWDTLKTENERAALVAPLIDVLGIRQLSRTTATRPQSVQDSEPNDYFRRILSEDIDEAEIRDQQVLGDIVDWLADRTSAMLDKLGAATERYERYVTIWEYFAGDVPNDRLNDLVDGLFAQHIATRPVAARLPALMSCWRERNRRGDKEIVNPEHLLRMLREALVVSLPLANDFYYFWTSVRYGPFSAEDRATVRRGVVAAAREYYAEAPRLIRALDVPQIEEPHRWSLRHLVEPADQEEPTSEFRNLDDWQWLAPVLLNAAKFNPMLVLGQAARLVGDLTQQMRVRDGLKESYELRLPKVTTLFGARDRECLGMLAGVSNTDDWILADASQQSAAFLKESRSTSD